MIFVILFFAILLCGAVLYLPYAAGLTSVRKQESRGTKPQDRKKKDDEYSRYLSPEYSRYLSPEEELRMAENEKAQGSSSAFKNKIKITSDDMPIKISLNQNATIRKRAERSVGDLDPNNYDYDLDQLIKEETEGEREKELKSFYASEHIGGDKEAMV